MNKKALYTKIILMLLCTISLQLQFTQAQDVAGIKAGFEKYSRTTLQEKLYVHTDRTFYMTGEILWFKLYNVDAGLNTPLDISKVAYVEILDNDNNAVLQAKIALQKGTGSGSLYIPVTLANGNYKLRAYTNWMKNFSPELYFEKQVTIVNPLISPDAPIKAAKLAYDVQFFPEGGTLVNGVASTVAFKAMGSDGKSADVYGAIISQQNDTVARFRSVKFGMGKFIFTPAAGNSYKAVIHIANNSLLTTQLPDAAAQGYVMHITDDGGKQLQVTITGNTNTNDALYLFAHNGPTVTAAELIHPDANHTQILSIDKVKLGDGINHLTLFNTARQPIAERLYFKRPALLNLQATAQEQYGLRKKAAISITAKGNNGQPQTANLSIAVYRLDSLNTIPDADIASYLWLTAGLKGNIEMPGYYFSNTSPATDEALDNLLLTQGWSRFKWTDVLSTQPSPFRFLPEYNGHLVTGLITDKQGAPARHTIAYMGVISKKVQLYGANSGITGQILFNTKDLYGANEIVLQTNNVMDTSTYHITLNNPFSEQYSSTKTQPFYINSAITQQLEESSLSMQVENLYRPENLRQFNTSQIDSTSFYYNQYKTFMLDNFTRFTTMDEVLREYVTNANVAKQGTHYHIRIINKDGYLPEAGDPLILLDGIPIFNLDKAFTIDPLKIKRLDLVNQRYYWGPVTANGILSYASYKTDLGGFELDPKAIVLDYEGMQLQREFYSPVYETIEQLKSRLPDFRNLLYWSPDVNTGADGQAQVYFYTSDKAGKYIGVIEGISTNGQAGSKYLIFDVK